MTEDMTEQHDRKTEEETKDNKLPIDKGWAYVVLFACFMEMFIFLGSMKAFGLLFVEFLTAYDTTVSTVSSILAIQSTVYSVAAILTLSIGLRKFTSRTMVIVGALITSGGYLLNAYTSSILMLMITQGLLIGMGTSIVHSLVLLMVSTYFDKRRGFANSVASLGGSIGGLVYPVLIRALLDEFNLQGTLVILSGMMLNLVIAGALLRPLEFYKSKHSKIDSYSDMNEEGQQIKINTTETQHPDIEDWIQPNGQYSSLLKTGEKQMNGSCELIQKANYDSTISLERIFKPVLNGNIMSYNSVSSLSLIPDLTTMSRTDIDEKEVKSSCTKFIRMFQFNLLKNHLFQMCLTIGFLAIYGIVITLNFLPDFAIDNGVSERDTAVLLTIASAADLCGRFVLVWISDSGFISRSNVISISLLVSGLSCMVNPFYTNFTSFAVFSSIYGFFAGTFLTLFPVLITDAIGVDNLHNGLAFQVPVHGLSVTIMAVVLGYMRDMTGAYNASYFCIGAGTFMASVILLLKPLIEKMEKRRQK